MNRTQLEHIICAASRISDDAEIVVGSQAIHAQDMRLPPLAYISEEANVYPRTPPNAPTILTLPLASYRLFTTYQPA